MDLQDQKGDSEEIAVIIKDDNKLDKEVEFKEETFEIPQDNYQIGLNI